MQESSTQPAWHNKLSHAAQLGGIETSVLDNGPGRGTRIAWINTGTGLRYKVVIDRAMDIVDAFHNQHSLAWISHLGVVAPQPFSNRGVDWLKTFAGGLLTTCGLSHVGGPEADEFGERGLHGPISNLAAEIESIVQPDPVNGKLDMSITGRMRQTTTFGPSMELRRTISGTLGQASLRVHDEVINVGNIPAPHMLLYHFNFGWPLLDEGTALLWNGTWQSLNTDPKIFKEGNDFKRCPAPLEAHRGKGEEAAAIDPVADSNGTWSCGVHNAKLGLAVALRFKKQQLPWLINWQHWAPGEYVSGIEPATHPPIGQAAARKQNTLIHLAPGERRHYDLELEVLDNPTRIQQFLTNTTFQ
ncbi:aldose 1-epimerase family protein [Chryseolinea lacunae]|uniref:Aldose 1-epimerase family protein n=1 Tax=Chryseolinea lacunae TaxID=2801331 RepID=A0ABS1L1Z2_9BACT|nr:aldose 1-epimerase family protein [Chryseolinea lacunae]MBL0745527.1 aldose 1-epimerase family protein [Chryseolinea lacunae]